MRRIRRTQTTVESHEVVILHAAEAGLEQHCPQCARVVRMLPAREAAAPCGVSLRILFRRMESGSLHFGESAGGQVYVCSRSISQT